MVSPTHPAYAAQCEQQATLATIRAELLTDHIADDNARNEADRAARLHLVKCSCGQYLQHITDTDER